MPDMKYPKPEGGVTKHCWGRKRRAAKKNEKRIWVAMSWLGILRKFRETAATCSWEETCSFRNRWGKPVPFIVFSASDYFGEYDIVPTRTLAVNFLETKFEIWKEIDESTGWPAKSIPHELPAILRLLSKVAP